MVNTKVSEGKVLRGAGALAKELGVSVQHLWKVRIGERRSPRIEAALKELGIRVGRPGRGRKGV